MFIRKIVNANETGLDLQVVRQTLGSVVTYMKIFSI